MSGPESPTDPLVGRTFSHYEIVATLGGGGMGVVYRARDLKLGRFVALKFLPPQWSHDDSAKQRFIREAQAASATHHKSICTIHDIDESDDGRLFIVMALYEGETLKQRLERGPLPVGEAMEIGVDVAEGLSKAHAQGVVHRDIKPGNIILTDDGAKILDFGLAKFADALQLTAPGSTVGTYAYMSPEQTRGEDADAQSDVWSWGVVMFQMLAGQLPFKGGYPEATFFAIKNDPLPSLRTLRPEVPEALELIVANALEKDRSDRSNSAREPARALRWLQGRTVPLDLQTEAVQAPVARSLAAAPTRRVSRAIMAGATVLLLAVAAATYWWMTRAIVRTPIAVAPVANHTGVASLDRYRLALTESLIDELRQSPNIRVVPYLRLVEIIRPFMAAPADVSSTDAVQAVASSGGAPFVIVPTLAYRDRDASWFMEVQIRNARTGTSVASFETTPLNSALSEQAAFRLVTAAAEQIQGHFKTTLGGRAYQPRAAATRFREPEAARFFAEGATAYEALEYTAAFDAFRQSAGLDAQHAMTQAWLSRVATVLNRKNDAVAAATRARQLAPAGNDPAEVLFADAVLAESQGDLASAEAAYQRLVVEGGDEMWARTELADFFKRRQDRNPQAIEAYHDVLSRDAAFVRPHVELCQLYTRIDDYPLAEKEAQASLDRYAAAKDDNGTAQTLLCLVEEQRKQGAARIADARSNAEKARVLFANLQQPYNLARSIFYKGLVEGADGRLADAVGFFREAATRLGEVGNRGLEGVALMNLGTINYQMGKPTAALEFFQRGRAVFLQVGDERRAAEADVNAAGVQAEYGIDRDAALRTLANARVNLERLGYIQFQLAAMQSEAETYRQSGRPERARTLLRSAVELARSRNLTERMHRLAVPLAQADLQMGDYATARASLETANQGAAGIGARVGMASLLTRLGDIAGARPLLRDALAEVVAHQQDGLRPQVLYALGSLALEEGDAAAASRAFSEAMESWRDPVPNDAVLEAQCDKGVIDAKAGRTAAARTAVDDAIAHAARFGHVTIEARCRVRRAEIAIAERRTADAQATLEAIPAESTELTLGPELRAEVEFWHARTLRATDAPRAAALAASARQRLTALASTLPPADRDRYIARAVIRDMLSPTDLRRP